ncbi:Cas10/Cmr2 second palm domain-containing protein [Vibrio chaetopteri]|uniref:Cas10/Cmr2 second palm domain-containing protein n=1 Tax=Vibrio chaetopteri TaxID=3016528 RepID=UPI003AB46654
MERETYHCYLFEAKSIQSYLFRSGKLKEIISASERLDVLIDDSPASPLTAVLKQLDLPSNLLESTVSSDNERFVYFTRCKGGAMFCYSHNKQAIIELRSVWTLTVSQLFPSLEFVDALASGEQLPDTMDMARQRLTADRNRPTSKLPFGTPIMALCQRTGAIAYPANKKARDNANLDYLNRDSILHLTYYRAERDKDKSSLLTKYANTSVDAKFPLDLEQEFPFTNDDNKEIALVHIDGNGMGLVLQKLQTSLRQLMSSSNSTKSNEATYREVLRAFSSALCDATAKAAKTATDQLYQTYKDSLANTSLEDASTPTFMPMRPLVLGGDDVTLLVRSDFAVDYALTFCKAFKLETQQSLQSVWDKLKQSNINTSTFPEYLTASGGIVFQKAGQPFTTANQFAEKLCKHAKELTKDVAQKYHAESEDDTKVSKVGPAALAYHKLASVMATDIDEAIEQVMTCKFNGKALYSGIQRFIVEDAPDNTKEAPERYVSFNDIQNVLEKMRAPASQYPITASKWRKLLGHLSQTEHSNVIRTLSLYEKHANPNYLDELQTAFAQLNNNGDTWWYWPHPNKEDALQTILSDLVILDRYWQPKSAQTEAAQ